MPANPAYRAEKMAEWTITTSNDGKYNQAYDNVATPLDTPGAYIVEAHAGERNQLRATTLVLVTDIAVVQKVDKDSVLAYVADSETGKPMPGVRLTVWEPKRLYQEDPELDASYVNGATNSEGQFRTTAACASQRGVLEIGSTECAGLRVCGRQSLCGLRHWGFL